MEYNVYIGLGSNVGEREKTIRAAFEAIKTTPHIRLVVVSSFYETSPWGNTDQPPFVNAAAKIKTSLPPDKLLSKLNDIEDKFGRERLEHWGKRTLDIDILHIEGVVCDTERLKLPHPYMLKRKFVLVPLDEIAATLKIGRRNIRQYLLACPDTGQVHKIIGSPRDFSMSIIACVDANWGIGKENRLLFDLPEDMALFRERTVGSIVVMGRKTMESLPGKKPLKSRYNLVLSRTLKSGNGFLFAEDIDGALKKIAQKRGARVFVIGGEEIFHEFMPYVGDAYITKVDAVTAADTFLPDLEEYDFVVETAENHVGRGGLQYESLYYKKQGGQSL